MAGLQCSQVHRVALRFRIRRNSLGTTTFNDLNHGTRLELADFVLSTAWPTNDRRKLTLSFSGSKDHSTVTGREVAGTCLHPVDLFLSTWSYQRYTGMATISIRFLATQVKRAADLIELCRGRLDLARTEITRIVADLELLDGDNAS